MKKYILILASAAALFSCAEKEDTAVSHDSITVSADTLKFGPDGGSMDLKVTSSGDWRLSGLCDWVTPSATEGKDGATITFNADPSNSKEAKEASFKVFTGSAVKKVVVTSTPAYVVSLISDSEASIVCDGGTVNVKLDTNVPDLEFEFSGDGAEWITPGNKSEAFGMTMQQFTIKKSKLFKNRESVVTIKGAGRSVNVKFVQSQRDTLFVEGNRTVFTNLDARDFELKMKTNIDYNVDLADWMTNAGETVGATGEDGLTEKTLKIHMGAAVASRSYTVKISGKGKEYVRYTLKQQNPNPVLVNIPDALLRTTLTNLGWILGDESSDECELLEAGLIGTSLSISSTSSWNTINIKDLTGLEAFPKLESLSLAGLTATSIDLSAVKTLKTLKINRIQHLATLKADDALTSVDFTGYSYDYLDAALLTISGTGIESIMANSSSYYISYGYEKLATIDVTGCPSLKDLQVNRAYNRYGSIYCYLNNINVTAAQKAAIDAGTLVVEKPEQTQYVVK